MSNEFMSECITRLRFPLALLVVLIHHNIIWRSPQCCAEGLYDCLTIGLSGGICQIAVPVFFFISGYLFFLKLDDWNWSTWIRKLKSRVNSLLVPYLIWNVLAFLATAIMTIKSPHPTDYYHYFIDNGCLRIFWDMPGGSSPADFPLWFIRDLMVCVVLSPAIWWLLKRIGGLAVVVVLIVYVLALPPFDNPLSSQTFPFVLWGGYCSLYQKFPIYHRLSNSISKIILCLFVAAFVTKISTEGVNEMLSLPSLRLMKVVSVPFAFYIVDRMDKSSHSILPKMAECGFFLFAAHTVFLRDVSFLITTKIIPITSHLTASVDYLLSYSFTVLLCLLIYYTLKRITPTIIDILCGRFKYIK